MQIYKSTNKGFTLIELLVVISIIGILIGLSVFGLQGARAASRDAKRKADLELIRSGIEIFKSDCNAYPLSDPSTNVTTALSTSGTSLIGNGSSTSCPATNTYISQVPADPLSPSAEYIYWSDGVTYELCTSLEQVPSSGTLTCGGISTCGGAACNYKVTNP